MAALLVALAVMSLLLSMAMPAWRTLVKREKEEELIFRGQQYARAIVLFQRKYANAHPPTMDVLVKQKFLRRQYKDPMVPDGEFQILYQGSMRQRPGGGPIRPGETDSGATPPQSGFGSGGGGFAQGGSSRLGSGSSGLGQGGSSGFGGQPAGPRGGIVGVASKSKDTSLRVYNGRTTYNEWQFVWSPATMNPGGASGVDDMGGPGGRGQGPGGFGNQGGGFGRGRGMGSGPGTVRPPGGIGPGGTGGMSDDR
jgi:type II secretory pathway pseudopilin PulG